MGKKIKILYDNGGDQLYYSDKSYKTVDDAEDYLRVIGYQRGTGFWFRETAGTQTPRICQQVMAQIIFCTPVDWK